MDSSEKSNSIADIFLSGGLFISSKMLARIFGFVSHIIIVQVLTPETLGNIALAWTITSTVASIALFGIGDGFPRLIAGSNSDQYNKKLIWSGLALTVGLGASATTIVFILTPLITDILGYSGISFYLRLFSLSILFGVLAGALRGILRGAKLSRAIALARDIVPKGGGIIILLPSVYVIGPELGVISYYISVKVLAAVAGAGMVWYILNPIISRPSVSHAKELLSFSWPLAVSSTFVMLMLNADILLLGYFLNSDSVGYYKAIRPISEIILVGLTSSTVIYLPIVTEFFEDNDYTSVDQAYTVVAKWLAIFSFPLVGVFVVFAPEVVVGFFGDEYQPGASALAILSLGMYARVLSGPNGATTQAIDRPQTELYAGITGFIINVALNVILIPSAGISGAAIATALGFFTFNLLELIIIYNETGAHPFSWDMVKPLIPSALLGSALFFIVPQGLSLPILVGIGIFWTTCQIIFVPITKSFGEMDKNILLQIDSPLASKFLDYMEWFSQT